jgi:anti-anti-sigma factor
VSEPLGPPLQIAVREGPHAHVVEVSGDLVILSRDVVGRVIEDLIDRGSHTIIVDAARLSHIDTPSLGLLTRLAARCRAAGGDLALTGLPERFVALAKALRLEEAMTLEESVDRALQRLGA